MKMAATSYALYPHCTSLASSSLLCHVTYREKNLNNFQTHGVQMEIFHDTVI